jgi:predicted metal-dependent hydrolase
MSPRDDVSAKRLWTVGGIPMAFERRNIKNLRIGIYAPHGEVRVAAPLRMDEGTVRSFIVSRFGWIVRKRVELERREPLPHRQFVSGEVHHFQGRAHVLAVVEDAGRAHVRRCGDSILQLHVPPGLDAAGRCKVLNLWYRQELRAHLDTLVGDWEARLGVKVAEVRIRQMKTRWGSCNARARRIWLNLDLISKPPRCLEYVLVHELVHFFERRHNPRFYAFMDEFVPEWRARRAELNRSPESC